MKVAKEAELAAEEFQVLTIRLDNLIARQVRASGLTDDYSESIKIASGYTKELQGWIAELAVTTPVNVADISQIVSYGLAFGWSVPQVKDLTKAIVDYTTAQGLQSDVTERILFNFAQMKAAGKVTATEMRDLAPGAFFPLTEVLDVAAKKLGVTAQGLTQFREPAAEGAIDVETFFSAFVEWVNVNLPDAGKQMNFTVKALKDNVRDLFEVMLGWNIFGPVVSKLGERLSRALQGLFTDENTRKAKLLGVAIADTFDQIWWAVTRVVEAIKQFFKSIGIGLPTIESLVRGLVLIGAVFTAIGDKIAEAMPSNLIQESVAVWAKETRYGADQVTQELDNAGVKWGQSLANTASKMFNWGAELVFNLMSGIVQAAARALIAAMNYISGILTSWLAPGSPPMIAPHIDEWGLQTMQEWLHGFTLADFSVLDAIQNPLKSIVDTMVDLGDISSDQMVSIFTDLSGSIAQALSQFEATGVFDPSIFDQLRSVGGAWGDQR